VTLFWFTTDPPHTAFRDSEHTTKMASFPGGTFDPDDEPPPVSSTLQSQESVVQTSELEDLLKAHGELGAASVISC
jgi:hypothetical protein